MPAQQRPQLILKIYFAVMLLLPGDVLLHLFQIRLAHGKIRVAALPLKARKIPVALLEPRVRDAFQFLHPFRLRDRATKPREDMNMIFHAADLDGRTIQLFGNAAQIRVQCISRSLVAQQRPPVFGRKDEVNVNGGKGLWHRWNRYARRPVVCQSQRDCVLQPKVAESARLPWVTMQKWIQPQRGCGECRARWTNGNGRNRVAVENIGGTYSQRSACLATLGFGSESRWDSRMVTATQNNVQFVGVTKSNRVRTKSIPTGLRPPAQGWRARAYLGFTFRNGNNLNEVVAVGAQMKTKWPQPRCGWEFFADADPG